jgi:hypothetical protein
MCNTLLLNSEKEKKNMEYGTVGMVGGYDDSSSYSAG